MVGSVCRKYGLLFSPQAGTNFNTCIDAVLSSCGRESPASSPLNFHRRVSGTHFRRADKIKYGECATSFAGIPNRLVFLLLNVVFNLGFPASKFY